MTSSFEMTAPDWFVALLVMGMSLLLNLIITPIVLHVAHRRRGYDTPDHRKIHSGLIPRRGQR